MTNAVTIEKMRAAIRAFDASPAPTPIRYYAGPNLERWLLAQGVPPHMIYRMPLTVGDPERPA